MEIILIATLMETAILMAALAVFFGARYFIKRRKVKIPCTHKKQIPADTEAKAIVLSIEPTGLYLNHQPQMKIQVQVIPEKGRNFVIELKEVLSLPELASVRTGSTVTVKYNKENLKVITLIKQQVINHPVSKTIRQN